MLAEEKLAPPKICMAGGKTSLAKKLYNKSYFEAGRSPRKRSILCVCEHFEEERNAEITILGALDMSNYSTGMSLFTFFEPTKP